MFSPAKAITAGALVFAIGGVLLIAQPFDQQGGGVPGAATDADIAAPVEVTGRFNFNYGSSSPQGGEEETLPGLHNVFTNDGSVRASDPRLEGVLTFISEEQSFVGNGLEASERLTAACEADPDECAEVGGPYLALVHQALSIENETGVWRQRPVVHPWFPGAIGTDPPTPVQVYDGEVGYDGLIAVLQFDPEAPDEDLFYGFILDARQLPPAPENASTR